VYVEMVCGSCESYFNCDADSEEGAAVWMMMHRFANAHTECGYMTRMVQEDDPEDTAPTVRKKIIKPRLKDDYEEDSEGS
jgi:hypothetical protein